MFLRSRLRSGCPLNSSTRLLVPPAEQWTRLTGWIAACSVIAEEKGQPHCHRKFRDGGGRVTVPPSLTSSLETSPGIHALPTVGFVVLAIRLRFPVPALPTSRR